MKLNDIVAISGLLLTLVTFLFNLAWPKIKDALEQDEAISGDRARQRCREKINNTAWGTVFPILVAFFVLFYVNLPTAFNIIENSEIALWDFNVDDTLYVMVVYALAAFVIFNGYIFCKLLGKRSKFK